MMPASPDSQAKPRDFDPRLLKQLACPVCFGDLRLAGSGKAIECAGCARVYPLIDGIPVLIAERATGSKLSL